MSLPVWLFVAYGGGHVSMVVPVAQRARELGLCEPVVLALTTAGPVARAAGLKTVGFSDFVLANDKSWLEQGARMAAQLPNPSVDAEESAAYLGMSLADLAQVQGLVQAEAAYRDVGRAAFLPVQFLERVLRQIRPQLVCATNSPRAERAALMAARNLGIPSACMVDLFAVDEKRWIGRAGFADRVCVLNEAVKQSLLDMERTDEEVVVTGNPAFDRLFSRVDPDRVADVRRRLGDPQRRVLLWASHVEPSFHPWRPGVAGNPELPAEVLRTLTRWIINSSGWTLAVRPHPSEAPPQLPLHSHVVLTGQNWPLTELLHACDAVCTLTSTVGLEAHLLGKPVVQVAGSIFEDAVPYARMSIAQPATLATLTHVIESLSKAVAPPVIRETLATVRVVNVLKSLVA